MLTKSRDRSIEEKVFGKDESYTLTDFLSIKDASTTEALEAYLQYSEDKKKPFTQVLEEIAAANRAGVEGIQEANAILAGGEFEFQHDREYHFEPGDEPIKGGKDFLLVNLNVRDSGSQNKSDLTPEEDIQSESRISIDWRNNQIHAHTISFYEEQGERAVVVREQQTAALNQNSEIERVDAVYSPYDEETETFGDPDRRVEIYTPYGETITMEQIASSLNSDIARAEIYDEQGDHIRDEKIAVPEGMTINDMDTEEIMSVAALPEYHEDEFEREEGSILMEGYEDIDPEL